MRPRWMALAEHERTAFRAVIAFLENRLEDRATINWALNLKPEDIVKRYALLELINGATGGKLKEPWRAAWRLIEESWQKPPLDEQAPTGAYHVQQRLKVGERSGSLMATIVDLVSPRLELRPFSPVHLTYKKLRMKPNNIDDLFSSSLTSGRPIDLKVVKIAALEEKDFLQSLAFALESVVYAGLDLARRIGWDGAEIYWKVGRVNRVYDASEDLIDDEPDKYSRGIAPSVKLLHTVVSRLIEIDKQYGIEFANRWKAIPTPVHFRLWISLIRDPEIATAQEIGDILLSMDDKHFWDIQSFPEIAELRARRFGELTPEIQTKVIARIRKGPPRNHWHKKVEKDQLERARLYYVLRELKRIEITHGKLPPKDDLWLGTEVSHFPELLRMNRYDDGFPDTHMESLISQESDDRYDLLEGYERLKALESALATGRDWNNDPGARANNWIQRFQNTIKVLNDLGSIVDGGSDFPKVWERFGWAHSPQEKGTKTEERNFEDEARCVRLLINRLSEDTIRQAINGISHWISAWEREVSVSPEGLLVWLRIWPIAVESTNLQEITEEEGLVNTVEEISEVVTSKNLDTLNSPSGKLVGAFLAACPTVHPEDEIFREGTALRVMRDEIDQAIGVSGSIVKSRLIEHLPYFLAADKQWTIRTLVPPLLTESHETLDLWKAVARQKLSFEIMEVLGNAMSERALDFRLDRKARQSLVFRIVVDCLYAYKDARAPFVTNYRIEQMLRSLDDEVRAHGAEAVQRFIRDLSKSQRDNDSNLTPENLFVLSAKPFLENVWPKEHSLVTPGVSRAFADLPSASGGAFAEAVRVVEPFLIPFECWSMSDYGLYGSADDELKLKKINDPGKAAAFLKLLDCTIGHTERAVVPHELADALEQIRTVAPELSGNKAYRRLAAAARR